MTMNLLPSQLKTLKNQKLLNSRLPTAPLPPAQMQILLSESAAVPKLDASKIIASALNKD